MKANEIVRMIASSAAYGSCQPNPFPGTNFGRGGTWNSPPADRARRYRADR